MVGISVSGDSGKTTRALMKLQRSNLLAGLHQYGQMGVDALSRATPVDTRMTANSWGYRIVQDRKGPRIEWYNTNVVEGTPVPILIDYGHGTGTGGYVQGREFISSAIEPIFDQIAADVWKKVIA